MKFHPILFSTEMVKALLEGRKTITRRSITHDKVNVVDPSFAPDWDYIRFFDGHAKFCEVNNHINEVYVKCPYGNVGDVLWVREGFYKPKKLEPSFIGYRYLTDDNIDTSWNGFQKKPSIPMPKAACRIFLQIKSIRAERLHKISEADAKAEGVTDFINMDSDLNGFAKTKNPNYRTGFARIWFQLNGRESWKANPWVWVIEFEQISKPQNFQ